MNDALSQQDVHDFWQDASCGEKLLLVGDEPGDKYRHQMQVRYEWEPEIARFAEFTAHNGQAVLEIGVGLGADHQMFAEAGANMYGIDLTERALQHTRSRFEHYGLATRLCRSEAEYLPFEDSAFDAIYSWGVIHHGRNIQQSVNEIHRVLKPGGVAKVMIYHKYSMTGLMLWTRYALLKLRPWRTLNDVFANHMESSGTKALSRNEARRLFARFERVDVHPTKLTAHDLLLTGAGQRHQGAALQLARRFYPRRLVSRLLPNAGIFLMIRAVK